MATIRQPIGSAIGSALGLQFLPIPKRLKDYIFERLEQEFHVFGYVLTANAQLRICGQSERAAYVPDFGNAGEIARSIKSLLEKSNELTEELESSQEESIRLRKSVEEATNRLEDIESTLRSPRQPIPEISRTEGGGPKVCCRLNVENISVEPDEQQLKANFVIALNVLSVEIARLELNIDIKFEYSKAPSVDEVSGICPGLCTSEVRRITTNVKISGNIGAKLKVIDWDALFGRSADSVDLSSLYNSQTATVSKPADDDIQPLGEGISIEFGGELTNFTERYIYEWRCVPGGGSTLELVEAPYTPDGGSQTGGSVPASQPGSAPGSIPTSTPDLPIDCSELYGKPKWQRAKWSKPATRLNNNCYNYACNIANATYAQPGLGPSDEDDRYDPENSIDCSDWKIAVTVDGLNPHGEDIDQPGDDCGPNCHKVALFLWVNDRQEFVDFHFARQDSDDLWSHKRADDIPKKVVDDRGRPVTSLRLEYMAPYNVFCGYHCVCKCQVQLRGRRR